MLTRNDHYFFDVEEFEMIIEHYLEQNDPRKAGSVLEYAKQQHPGALDLLFCEAHLLMSTGKLNKALEVLDAIAGAPCNTWDRPLEDIPMYTRLLP